MGSQVAVEQACVDLMYVRLDELTERTEAWLRGTLAAGATGTAQGRGERDSLAEVWAGRLMRLRDADAGLCFGRLEMEEGERHHIGRIGLAREDGERLLVDWRAPVASAFYAATALDPHGVLVRRRIAMRGRTVTAVDDELLQAAGHTDDQALSGDAALLRAVTAPRTGRMHDIVATIQAGQDAIIRSPMHGALVVEGGPGTGKTVVALHRVAYLLYTHRERLGRSGVLLVGPNSHFLRYIEDVLPSLGETATLTRTPSQLVPGVTVTAEESEDVAALKGDVRMAEVVAAAVAAHEGHAGPAVSVEHEGKAVRIRPDVVRAACDAARATLRPHNSARRVFVRKLLLAIADDIAPGLERGLGRVDRVHLAVELYREPSVAEVLDELWPVLTPEALVEAIYTDAVLREAAGAVLTPVERELLPRPAGAGWTPADVALVDEARHLLGTDEAADRRRRRRRADESRATAREATAVVQVPGFIEVAVDGAAVAHRYADAAPSTASQAAGDDATWLFGHIVVDEAQELSPMQWRCIRRRSLDGSMTIVGDMAQQSAPGAAASWEAVVAGLGASDWRRHELTVNYRTPAEVMAVAEHVLRTVDPALRAPLSVRATGHDPVLLEHAEDRDLDAVLNAERQAVAPGTVGVIATRVRAAVLRRRLEGWEGVEVLEVREAKGQEFDAVVIVDPAAILAASSRGMTDLYVALTRATQRLVVVAPGELPAPLADELLTAAGRGS